MYKCIFALCLVTTPTWSFDNGQYENVDPKIREWFQNQRAPNSRVPCCSVADGHNTTWRKSETLGYEFEVPIEGVWVPVPNETIIKNSNNPTNEAIVWYVKQSNGQGDYLWHIRCFILGSGA